MKIEIKTDIETYYIDHVQSIHDGAVIKLSLDETDDLPSIHIKYNNPGWSELQTRSYYNVESIKIEKVKE